MLSKFRAKLLAVVSISLVFLIPDSGICANSAMDASASVSGQYYPLGGMVTGYLGYGVKIWSAEKNQISDGSPSTSRSTSTSDEVAPNPDWHYGYIRPNLQLQTTAVTNRITGAFDFYPISIFGITAGAGADFKNYDHFSGIDCGTYVCDGEISFQFLQAKFIGGIGKLSLIASARYDLYYAQNSERNFYDYMSYLVGVKGKDDLRSLNLISLYRLNSKWSVGGLGIFQTMVRNGTNNGELAAISNYTIGKWQLSLGAGAYHSDHQPLKPSVLFLLTYTANKSIGLIP